MKIKNRHLPNDVLQLYCKCASVFGIVLKEIENISYGYPPLIQNGNLINDDLESKKMFLDSTRILKENQESSYKKNLHCDTKVMRKTGSISAYKSLLSPRLHCLKQCSPSTWENETANVFISKILTTTPSKECYCAYMS
ncbi:hypothetical protein TNCV_4363611 [Trichonephila clavipes]|nr:hypothetical protein TNCV_4363611 [Trichonephila clavipes]